MRETSGNLPGLWNWVAEQGVDSKAISLSGKDNNLWRAMNTHILMEPGTRKNFSDSRPTDAVGVMIVGCQRSNAGDISIKSMFLVRQRSQSSGK